MAGKQETGSAALGMGGYHAARTGRTGAALPATRSVDAPLPSAGGTTLPGTGGTTMPGMRSATLPGAGLRISHIPERSSATAIARSAGC